MRVKVNKSNESGRSMIEVLMVLSIIGILGIGTVKLISSVHDKFKLSRIGAQITDLSKIVSDRYMSLSRYTDLDAVELAKEGILPKDMVERDFSLYHAFGGRVRIRGDKITFKITFLSLDRLVCHEMALLNWAIGDTTNLVSVTVNDDKYIWSDPQNLPNNVSALPITVPNSIASCENGKENTIIWEFE